MFVSSTFTTLPISTHALTEGDFVLFHFSQVFLISTHALTEGDRAAASLCRTSREISTHALTEGDCEAWLKYRLIDDISTHALTEGDLNPLEIPESLLQFQLTPSRRAT